MTLSGTTLAAHRFLHGMDPEHLNRLATLAHHEDLPTRYRFFHEGGRADRCWLIQAGQVALDLHIPGRGNVLIETLGQGTVLGWSWLFPPYEWQFGAVAVTPVRAIALEGPAVRGLCGTDPVIGYELTRRFAAVMLDRLQNTRMRLLDLHAKAPERSAP